MPITAAELGYLAGFFDGEGCIDGNRRGAAWGLRVSASNTDERPLRRLQSVFGGSIYSKRQGDRRSCSVWQASGRKAARFLEVLLPYLVVKRAQAEAGLRLYDLRGPQGGRWNGHGDYAAQFVVVGELRRLKKEVG
jgi:hypothetical protein